MNIESINFIPISDFFACDDDDGEGEEQQFLPAFLLSFLISFLLLHNKSIILLSKVGGTKKFSWFQFERVIGKQGKSSFFGLQGKKGRPFIP